MPQKPALATNAWQKAHILELCAEITDAGSPQSIAVTKRSLGHLANLNGRAMQHAKVQTFVTRLALKLSYLLMSSFTGSSRQKYAAVVSM